MHEKLHLKWQHNAHHTLNTSQNDITRAGASSDKALFSILIKEIKVGISVFMREQVFFPYLFWKPINGFASWLDTESIISPQQMHHTSAVTSRKQSLKVVGFPGQQKKATTNCC